MKRKLRINGHSHLLPYPEEIPKFMKDKGIFWVDKDRKFMLQKDWSRPVTDSSFFLDEKLEWMDEFNIDHAVVLNLSQLYEKWVACGRNETSTSFSERFQRESPTRTSFKIYLWVCSTSWICSRSTVGNRALC